MTPAPRHVQLGDAVGPYQLVRLLGRGGTSEVFEGHHAETDQRVAIKLLPTDLLWDPKVEDYAARFREEARVINRIRHPGVVQVLDLGALPDGRAYLVMELLAGVSLRQRLRERGAHPADEVLALLRQLAAALAVVHEAGILHRDLKPENVMLTPADGDGGDAEQAKILDFGLARLLDAPERLTTEGRIMGTPAYMAPEQCLGEAASDRTDVYALGVLGYELVAGAPPFRGPWQLLLEMHLTLPPPPLTSRAPGVPRGLADLIAMMLAKTPGDRPSMADVLHRIETLRGGPPAPRGFFARLRRLTG
mgnify:CR=1 FL=1